MTTIYKYKVFCITTHSEEFIWSEEPPTKCPSDPSHEINTDSISIINQISENKIKIEEESTPTGGHFRVETVSIMNIPANESVDTDIFYPIPISVLELKIVTDESNIGDNLRCAIAPDTIIGVITAPTTPGLNDIQVSSTVFEHLKIGFDVELFCVTETGPVFQKLGRTLELHPESSKIKTEFPLTQVFNPLLPTYVRMTVYNIDNYTIGKPALYAMGSSKIGGTHIPANIHIRITYKNNTNQAKSFIGQIEYLF